MQIIMLLRPEHHPVPANISVYVFGSETIRSSDGRCHYGESALVEAPPEVLHAWLKPFDSVWISDNPLVGDWRIVHVKDTITV